MISLSVEVKVNYDKPNLVASTDGVNRFFKKKEGA
jgi:hypothetical protein